MSQHTPGPWIIGRSHSWNVIKQGLDGFPPTRSVLIASAHFGGYEPNAIERAEVDANARLIAAAPELLEACKAMLQDCYESDSGPCDECKAEAVAAIAKAEGRAE